ncbi:MAG: HupE/UreJ family protein [Rubrimonas sp.]
MTRPPRMSAPRRAPASALGGLLLILLAALAAALTAAPARAHQTALAILSVVELQPGRYALRWENRPMLSDAVEDNAVYPIWPDHCVQDGPMLGCGDQGLSGRVGFAGLGATQSAAMFRIRALDGATQVVMLTPSAPTARVQPNFDPASWSGRAQILSAYTALGIEHILIGIDHLLFVLGLMWIASTRWALVRTITAFTVAHSLTLAAVTFGWVGVPEGFVNAMIALSIVFVGVEILRREAGRDSVTLRMPWLVAFGFGLLHGFGFANALLELGLPERAATLALFAFNLGVEIGQLAFVFLALALGWAWRAMTAPRPERAGPPAAYAIGALASFWFIDRAVALLGG